jgi:hypothetical protein
MRQAITFWCLTITHRTDAAMAVTTVKHVVCGFPPRARQAHMTKNVTKKWKQANFFSFYSRQKEKKKKKKWFWFKKRAALFFRL